MYSVRNFTTILFKIHCNVVPIYANAIALGFPTKIVYTHLVSTVYAARTAYLIYCFDHHNNVWSRI